MLTYVRPKPIIENVSDDALKGPNKEVILQITKDLPTHDPTKYIPSLYYPADVNIYIHIYLFHFQYKENLYYMFYSFSMNYEEF